MRQPARDIRVDHRPDRTWYLASTIKIPLAIAVMQEVEAGEIALDEEIELQRSDWVDGTGDLLYHEPGDRFTVLELIKASLQNSDSTATDMLVRRIGEARLNNRVQKMAGGDGFGPITTILQVRHDAWSEVHPDATSLTNMDFIDLKKAGQTERHTMVLDKLSLQPDQANADSMREAFARYYAHGRNSGSLTAFGDLLEALLAGELLNEENTRLILSIMENITTGDRRIQSGLPAGVTFAQKTGTQIQRACNVGIVAPDKPEQAVIIVACTQGHEKLSEAETAFRRLGKALSQAGLVSVAGDDPAGMD